MYEWTASVNGPVTLAIQLRHDPGYWFLDDVSVSTGGVAKVVNGGFETGLLSPWTRTIPNGACTGHAGNVTSSYGASSGGAPHSGTYFVNDGSTGCADQLSQSFTVVSGTVYNVSFWLKSSNSTAAGTVTGSVTLG